MVECCSSVCRVVEFLTRRDMERAMDKVRAIKPALKSKNFILHSLANIEVQQFKNLFFVYQQYPVIVMIQYVITHEYLNILKLLFKLYLCK